MKTVDLQYYICYGRGDYSDYEYFTVELTDEEAALYDKAVAKGIPFEDIPELADVLDRARMDIEGCELECYIDMEDEGVLEALGLYCMDEDELNDLVHNRDPHALQYFGLEDATDEEITSWDANALDEIPAVKDFEENFVPEDPFENLIDLRVEFVEPDGFGEFEFDDEDEDEE